MSTDPRTAIQIAGLTTTVLVPSSVLGSCAVLEHVLRPGFLGAPLHRHRDEDEVSHVLEGALTVMQDGDVSVVREGETVVKARDRLHTFWNAGDVPVRFLEVVAPATGFDRYFAEIAPFVPNDGPPDVANLLRVAGTYGLTLDMGTTMRLLGERRLEM